MKKFLKVLTASAMALAMSLVALTGCTATPTTTVKTPTATGSGAQSSTGTESQQVGLTAGFALSHDSGLVDNDDTQVNVFDSEYY